MSAEEALQSLARDLIEEISAARAVELTGELPGFVMLAAPSAPQVTPEWAAREQKGRQAAETAWNAHSWQPKAKSRQAADIGKDIGQTAGTHLPGTEGYGPARQHLRNAETLVSDETDRNASAKAYQELARAHAHIRDHVLPDAKPEEYPQVARHLQRVSGHMHELDRLSGTRPESTRNLLGSFHEAFAHAGEARRAKEFDPRTQPAPGDPRQAALEQALAQVPPPPKGAQAVHPHLTQATTPRLPGETLAGWGYGHVPRPFDVEAPSADQARALKAEDKAKQAADELDYQRGLQASAREQKQNAAVLERMGLPAPGEYRPMDDDEFTLHQQHADDVLEKAHRDGLSTSAQHTASGDGQTWEPDRASLHGDIFREWLDKQANVPSQRHAIMLGGPGSGKSALLRQKGLSPRDYALVSTDFFKEQLARRGMVPEVEGLSPGESSALTHDEAQHLTRLAVAELARHGKNVALDVALHQSDASRNLVQYLKNQGYTVTGLLADTPGDAAADQGVRRYRSGLEAYRRGTNPVGARHVLRHDLLHAETGPGQTTSQQTFDGLKPQFDDWEHWDTAQRPAVLKGRSREQATPNAGIPSPEELHRLGTGTS